MSASVADQFSAIAAEYEAHWAQVLMPANRELVAMVPMADARSVLDLGGGVGSLVPVLQEAAPRAHVVVSDRAEGMVRRVRLGSPVVADAKRLPFRSQSFDAVILTFVLQFIDDPDRMFGEIARVLRHGGAVAVAAWGEVMKAPSERMWLEALDEFDAPEVPTVPAAAGKATVTLAELDEQLTRTGFDRVETRRLRWVDQPDVERFIQRMTNLGPSSRRLAAWDDRSRTLFVESVRTRLNALDPHEFLDDSEVLAAVGTVQRRDSSPNRD
jgi:ubiquinone/menaquinone biosynthesis C-methylase UbiE